ncbi:MAG: 50S ribosomal protein L4 [Pseudomonadota bacterium]
MELKVQSGESLQVSDSVFAADYREPLIHQVVTAYRNAARAGTKAQKNRAAVRGGGAKPYRQKGTGRARQGTSRSPILRSGGVTFAASPRSYAQKVNRKMYRGAIRSILSELVRQERLVIVEQFDLAEAKTKALVAKVSELQLNDVLLVTAEFDEKVWLASRNLYYVGFLPVNELDPIALIGFEKVLMTTAALRTLEERLA